MIVMKVFNFLHFGGLQLY